MTIKAKKEKRNLIAKQMRALNDEIGDAKWNDDHEKRWGDMQIELDQLDLAISREERLLQLESDELNLNPETRDLLGDKQKPTEKRAAVFDAYLRGGVENLDSEQRALLNEMRAQSVSTADKGGFTVPTEFRDRVVESMKQFGGLANISTVFETEAGNPIQWVITDGTAEIGAMIGESTQADAQDLSFSQASIGAKKMTSKVILVSNELLLDSGVDIYGLIGRRCGTRIGRGEASQLINGDGTGNNIKGLLLQASTGYTAATQTALSWGDLLSLKHSVDPAYRAGGANWLWNDQTLLAIKSLKDSQGRPLWLPDVAGLAPATFDGDKYQIDQAMPAIAAGKAPVAYGDFSAFQIRRVKYQILKRLVEKYAEADQTGFVMFHRFDALLEDVAAVKLLKQAA
jgi:phage major capsid protein, HK97 family